MSARGTAGFTLLEALISVSILSLAIAGAFGLLVQNSKINKAEQLNAEVQANARSALSSVVKALRRAGWDPMGSGIDSVALDPDPSDDVSQIEIFADLDEDATTLGPGEQVLIRHDGDRIEWRRSAGGEFRLLAPNISNDADGDGTIEPMFVPVPNPNPTRIQVRITARAPSPHPVSGEPIRFTVSSDVVLRKSL
jgi:type II secretory pathway pseudopilin PulG